MTAPITVVGNLTRAPELRYTSGGRGVANFGVAANRRYQSNGEWVEETSFFNITAWGELAEHVAECLDKGARVVIQGRLTQRSYETQEGEKRSVVEIVADDIGASMRWATVTVTKTEREKPRVDQSPPRPEPTYSDDEPF